MDNDPKYEKAAKVIARHFQGEPMRWRMATPGILTVLLTDGRKIHMTEEDARRLRLNSLPEPKPSPRKTPAKDKSKGQDESTNPEQ